MAARNAAARMPPRLVIDEADIEEAFLKGSGPGGQKIVGIFKTRLLRFVTSPANRYPVPRTKLHAPSNSSTFLLEWS